MKQIELNSTFLNENPVKAKNCILPELLGRWFSCPPDPLFSPSASASRSNDDTSTTDENPKYCYCQRGKFGDMIGCDNKDCSYEWFHLNCLHLAKDLKVKTWYCPDCCKLDKFSRKKGKCL